MKKLKTPLLFALAMLPIAFIAGLLVCIYQIDIYSDEMMEEIFSQIGSREALVIVGGIQSAIYAVICAFFGSIMAKKLGLWKPIKFEKKPFGVTLVSSVVFGILFSLDYWVFGGMYPAIQEGIHAGITPVGVISSILYGGIVEELLLRLFFMSLVALIVWKLFYRRVTAESIPDRVFIIANVVAAIAFAAGHIPATVSTFGEITLLLLIRCFLLNGGFGLFFGWLYRKYGIQYAMMGHALLHIVSKCIWVIFTYIALKCKTASFVFVI